MGAKILVLKLIEVRLKNIAHIFVQMNFLIIQPLKRFTTWPQAMLGLNSVAALGLLIRGRLWEHRYQEGTGQIFYSPCAYPLPRGKTEELS